jgi:hypothetical protein
LHARPFESKHTLQGGDSYQTPAAAVYARYNKSALYPALEKGLQPCSEACNAQYMCGILCLHPSLYLDQHNGTYDCLF